VAGFGSVKQAINYCGLCGAERSSADMVKRMPISKQRNKHLQSVLVEAAKLGPRLALVYEAEKQKGHANRATVAVARLVVPVLSISCRMETS
jgi:transposase